MHHQIFFPKLSFEVVTYIIKLLRGVCMFGNVVVIFFKVFFTQKYIKIIFFIF